MAETEDFIQLSLNLDTSAEPFVRKKTTEKVVGNRRSRIKQRREIKSGQKTTTTTKSDLNNQSERAEEGVGKKRKHSVEDQGDKKRQQDPFPDRRFIKQRKTDGIISSLFNNNPEIPQIENSKVDVICEEVFAGKTFKELPIHPYLVSNLEEKLGFTELTQIQQKGIPVLLNRKDALIKSQTGSGKTLAYAVPIIQTIQSFQRKVKREDGPYALVIVPTRELVIQTYHIFSKLLRTFIWIVPGCLMGGEKKKAEKSRLRKGVNILVTTPGRLLDHINTTQVLSLSRVQWLVIDEADRLLELGYERDVAQILNALNAQCQDHNTVLLSATLSEGVERLSSITMRDPKHISLNQSENAITTTHKNGDSNATATAVESVEKTSASEAPPENFSVPSQLNQHFLITPCKLRLVMLASWILWKCRYSSPGSKMIVFMSTQDAVEFHWQLFSKVLNGDTAEVGLVAESKPTAAKAAENKQGEKEKKKMMNPFPLFHLHGEMKQSERTETFHKFSQTRTGILLSTDVAARGLDLPKVDWIVQYTLPGQTVDYIHRIGRTARAGTLGQSLLFLMPSEIDYVKELNKHQLSLTQMDTSKILKNLLAHIKDFKVKQTTEITRQTPRTQEEAATFLQDRFEELLRKDQNLHQVASKGFQSYIRAYATYSKEVKAVLKAKELHLGHVAKSFGLRDAPSQVHGQLASSKAEFIKQKKLNKMKINRPQSFQQAALSEFSSGLPSPKKKFKKFNR